MTPEETHEALRKNFIDKTKHYFSFLVTEFDFDKPIYTFFEQLNGSVISDKFEFNCSERNLKITVYNSYHPVDYGFEINLTDLKTGKEEMVHNMLKENQDIEQNYLKKASEYLKEGFGRRLRRE